MLFDSTVRRELAKTFGATLVVILTIVLTMMLIRTLGLAAGGAVAPQDVVLLLGYTALGHLPTMLNLSLFVAVVATLGRMYRDSEMAVWFASGVALGRFVRPVLRMAWPVLLAVAVLALFVWPWGNRNSTELRERYAQRSDVARVAPGQFQTSSDGRRVFFIERDSEDGTTGRNVFILTNQGHGEAVTSARSGRIEVRGDERHLVLDRGQRNERDTRDGEATVARFERYSVLVGEKATRTVDDLPPRARSTADLLLRPDARGLGELAWRIGLVLAGANMLLLGIGLAATHPRRPSNWNLLFALLGFVVYFNLINLTQAWVGTGRLGMGTALIAVHGSILLLALALLWWRVQGTTLVLRPRRATERRSPT
jgi:lipopolysaccharide export system permease protein